MTTKLHLAILTLLLSLSASAQITGSLSGTVQDEFSEQTIPFATVQVKAKDTTLVTVTDIDGRFQITQIPVGRVDVTITSIGFDPIEKSGVLINSGQTENLTIGLRESSMQMETVTIKTQKAKEAAINQMAVVSAKQLSMEEANRYAGGFDDPARLVASFAGVASNVSSNGLVIRGNSPKGVLWRMEGIDIPNPNHFAEIAGFGGGGITALSSKMIGNSDFFSSAFPAEYGNALAGVMDLSIRNGSNTDWQHSAQIGVIGTDISSEGPFKKDGKASYLFNYRYSTLDIVDELLFDQSLGIKYQDLSFKLRFPTEKAGVFSIWGLGLMDQSFREPDTDTLDEESKWKYRFDLLTEENSIYTGIVGLTHKIYYADNGFIKTSLVGSTNSLSYNGSQLDSSLVKSHPTSKIHYQATDLKLMSVLNHKLNKTNLRAGIILTNTAFNFDLAQAPTLGQELLTYSKDEGNSQFIQAFAQTSSSIGKLQINPGVHFSYLALNGNASLEPRLGVNYQIDAKNRLSFGYGLHSQMEKLSYYLADIPSNQGIEQLNKDLELSKSHHLVIGYNRMINDKVHFNVEPYFQYLYNIPVVEDSYFSMINLSDEFFINEKLVNEGTGRNIGIDFTLERFLNKGWYYLTTLSLFDSKYEGGDGKTYNTKFNKNIVSNFLIGKEWTIKEKNLLSASVKYTYLGGNRQHPYDLEASLAAKEAIDDLSRPFGEQNPGSNVLSMTFTYRVNKEKYSSHWSLQILNMLNAKEYWGYHYNFREQTIDEDTDVIMLPNLSYRIDF